MGGSIVASAPSEDVVRPTSNSVPEPPGTQESPTPGRAAGSPDESNTKTQKPHDAFFMDRRALETGLWKTRTATILFPQKKLMGDEERRL